MLLPLLLFFPLLQIFRKVRSRFYQLVGGILSSSITLAEVLEIQVADTEEQELSPKLVVSKGTQEEAGRMSKVEQTNLRGIGTGIPFG